MAQHLSAPGITWMKNTAVARYTIPPKLVPTFLNARLSSCISSEQLLAWSYQYFCECCFNAQLSQAALKLAWCSMVNSMVTKSEVIVLRKQGYMQSLILAKPLLYFTPLLHSDFNHFHLYFVVYFQQFCSYFLFFSARDCL